MKYFVLAEALPTFTGVQNWIVDAVLTFIYLDYRCDFDW